MVQRQNHISFIAHNNIYCLDLIWIQYEKAMSSFVYKLWASACHETFKISMMVISPFKDEKYDLRVPEAVTK